MRLLRTALVLLIGYSVPAIAAAATAKPAGKPAPAHAASPAPAPAKGVYAAMTDAERFAIQSDLIWTGDYNGVVGAEFGDRAVAAVQAYQKRNGGKDTGILNPDERAKLAQAAKSRQEQAGWRIVDDAATGARLGIPQKLVPQAGQAKAGSRWQSGHGEVQIETFRVAAPGTTLAGVFEEQKKEPAGRKVEYNVLRPDFFVISGLQGLKKFYVRGQAKDNEVRGLTILYDQALEGTVDRIAVAMSSAFVAFPAQAASRGPGAPPQGRVRHRPRGQHRRRYRHRWRVPDRLRVHRGAGLRLRRADRRGQRNCARAAAGQWRPGPRPDRPRQRGCPRRRRHPDRHRRPASPERRQCGVHGARPRGDERKRGGYRPGTRGGISQARPRSTATAR